MKIRSLRIEEFKKFDQAVLVDGFGDGLNLLAGPNEAGKSTLLLALRAALFERHGAKTQAVKDFAPHHVTGAKPTISITFEIGGERYRLEKRFLKRPAATLAAVDGRRRFDGSEAEDELKRLLALDASEKTSAGKDSPAHFGVLLTPQTLSFHQPDLADGTRHTLEAAIAADIAELGNQSEVDGLLAEFDAMLFDFVDKRGKPKNRYKDVDARLAEVEREIAQATGERDALREQLEQLEEALAERSELQAANARDKLSERLATLEASRAQAVRRQALENRRLEASQRLRNAETKHAARQARLEKKLEVAGEIEAIEKTIENAKKRLGMVEETLSERENKLADLGDRLRTAGQRRRDLETLGRLYERQSQIEATLAALATDVRLELETSALSRVRLDGEPAVTTRDVRQVTEGLSIEIEGIGRIGIEPKTEPMRDALDAKAEVENEIGRLLQMLGLDDTEREAIETAWKATAADLEKLEASRTELETTLAEERRQTAEAKAVMDTSADRRALLAQRLVEIDAAGSAEGEDEITLDAEIAAARSAFDDADGVFQSEARRQGPDASSTPPDAEIAALRARIEERRRALDDADKRVVALEAAIAVRSDLGLDEKIDQLERKRHLKSEERDAFALDHQALSLLQSTLRDAANEAKATFNAPLSARLAPYVQDLFPGATPLVTPDFSIRAIDRSGVEEPFLQLSDGTREQIAILARLAFADMLQEQGLPALIVLDDALAFSDDRRLERMFAILEKAAARMQVVILTCREERFAGVEATRLRIEPAPETASSAA
ncbi:MAG: AAA family ATPase [Geminicoccaceae bacterium]